MRNTSLFLALALIALGISPALAQDINGDGKVTFLVPLNVQQPSPGAHGTIWQTQVWLHNGWDVPFTLADCGPIIPCFGQVFGPGATDVVTHVPLSSPYVFNVDAFVAQQITLSGRLFELAKKAQPAGVHFPIVREAEFFTGPVRFLAIDATLLNRVAVRVFDPLRVGNGAVRLAVVSTAGNVVASTDLSLGYGSALEPGYGAIFDIAAALPAVAGLERYDLIVTPLTAGMSFWAVVSVTDQETQQVLLITPD